jgi:hypothetical protein
MSPLTHRWLGGSAVIAVVVALAGCGWDWSIFDPVDGGSPVDVQEIDVVSDIGNIDAAVDAADCGRDGQACCATSPRCADRLACMGSICSPCASPTTECGGACVNIQTDRFNCGFCGRGCSGTNRNCDGGRCVP